MINPAICAVCLYADRPTMLPRAIASFRAQTYENKWLVIYDNGKELAWPQDLQKNEIYVTAVHDPRITIGELRNHANAFISTDIICHWDSDDWSHPNRMSEQVALLQASGKECVGYRDMLFWRTAYLHEGAKWENPTGTAWLYTNNDTRYALGTSLCYWKETWKRVPFKHLPLNPPVDDKKGSEDGHFVKSVDCVGILGTDGSFDNRAVADCSPRMIASIHGSNNGGYNPFPPDPIRWKRVPEWDAHCREIFK